MGKLALADAVDVLGVNGGEDINGKLKAVPALGDLTPYLGALPLVPFGDMLEFGDAVLGDHIAVLVKGILLATLGAGEGDTTADHMSFSRASRTFVEHAVEIIGTEGLVYFDTGLLLPAKVVECEGGADGGVDLVLGHLFDLVR